MTLVKHIPYKDIIICAKMYTYKYKANVRMNITKDKQNNSYIIPKKQIDNRRLVHRLPETCLRRKKKHHEGFVL